MKETGLLILIFSGFIWSSCSGQSSQNNPRFTHADTLRGSVTPERAWWDVLYYDISVKPDFNDKFISGTIIIKFKVLQDGKRMQIDLQQPMQIKKIGWNKQPLEFERDGNVFYVTYPNSLHSGNVETITIEFEGHPKIAKRPPWDAGWIFTRDRLQRPWITATSQGIGASGWYPCKDYLGDEPDDGASLSITVPDTLVAVGNGRLKQKKENGDGTSTYQWSVVNPINNYNIIPYIGKYVSWHRDFDGEQGKLDCDFWVLDYNLDIAKIQFRAVDSMLKCFEYWFGPYPFYQDGYKLVEAPHLGMEHQSAVAYGNQFQSGYAGTDLSGSGRGLKWDFIIVHESGHEWFGNNISARDAADQWIHESFTSYSETLFTEYYFGKEAANEYIIGVRKRIENKKPIIGAHGVNNEPQDNDEYYKGANMLHTIRQIIDNDSLFRQILRGLNKTFYHQTVTTKQVQDYINMKSKINFSKVFDQYLTAIQIPALEYKQNGYALSYRWINCIKGFNMPVRINFKGSRWIKPTEKWQILSLYPEGDKSFSVDPLFYIYKRNSN